MRKKNINHTFYASDFLLVFIKWNVQQQNLDKDLYIPMSDIFENKNIFEEENDHKLSDF